MDNVLNKIIKQKSEDLKIIKKKISINNLENDYDFFLIQVCYNNLINYNIIFNSVSVHRIGFLSPMISCRVMFI